MNAQSTLATPQVNLRIEFTKVFRLLGADWIASTGQSHFLTNPKNAAVLVPMTATFRNRSHEFEWPGQIADGCLTVFDMPEDLAAEISFALGLDTLRDRVRMIRAARADELEWD